MSEDEAYISNSKLEGLAFRTPGNLYRVHPRGKDGISWKVYKAVKHVLINKVKDRTQEHIGHASAYLNYNTYAYFNFRMPAEPTGRYNVFTFRTNYTGRRLYRVGVKQPNGTAWTTESFKSMEKEIQKTGLESLENEWYLISGVVKDIMKELRREFL